MFIISPGTPIQRRVSLIMIIINLVAIVSVGALITLLHTLYKGGHIDTLSAIPRLFEIFFASWIPSLYDTYGQLLASGDVVQANVVLMAHSVTWLAFIAVVAAFATLFVHQWSTVLPALDSQDIQIALDQKRKFDRTAHGIPMIGLTLGIMLFLGSIGMHFFGAPEYTAEALTSLPFDMLAMPMSMLFTLLLFSGVVTLIFNFAIEKRLSQPGSPHFTEQLSPL